MAIRFKLRLNYHYCFDWRDVPPSAASTGYKGSYFNIMIEFPRKVGVTVALEFSAAEKILWVITTIYEARV
jgi:hypothetical protein